jgi:predicted NBD/HSP70 family sugar kinase
VDADLPARVADPAPSMMRGAVRQSTLRRANLALVARTVCASATPMSRAAVATATAMTRSTVSRLADDLVAGGVLDELDPPVAVGPGRPAVPMRPGSSIVALGLEANVDRLVARVYDLGGTLVAERIEYADLAGSDHVPVLARLSELSVEVLAECPPGARLAGAGLALPGVVTTEEDHLVVAPNLGWTDLHPADHLQRAGLRGTVLRVGNDANLSAHAVAEPLPGRPGPLTDFVYVSGDTGIGGAAVVHGRLVTGRHGWAGEIGHMCVDPTGPRCRCGAVGCLEQFAGSRAMLAAAGLPASGTAQDLERAARAGDPRALSALESASRALGLAMSAVVNVLDIPDVVLGGHLAVLADHLRPGMVTELRDRVVSARWAPPTVHRADVGVAPGATGAAFVELDRVLADPSRWVDTGF